MQISPQDKLEIERELKERFEPLLLCLASSNQLIKDFISTFKTFEPEYKQIIQWFISEKAKHQGLYVKELEQNGFSREEAMKLLLNDKTDFAQIIKQFNIKGKI
jgi:hypothetical protein